MEERCENHRRISVDVESLTPVTSKIMKLQKKKKKRAQIQKNSSC